MLKKLEAPRAWKFHFVGFVDEYGYVNISVFYFYSDKVKFLWVSYWRSLMVCRRHSRFLQKTSYPDLRRRGPLDPSLWWRTVVPNFNRLSEATDKETRGIFTNSLIVKCPTYLLEMKDIVDLFCEGPYCSLTF